MIHDKRLTLLFVCLTLMLLVACEPLAPEQTPNYVVVTGDTPNSTPVPSPSPLVAETAPALDSVSDAVPDSGPDASVAAAGASSSGVINTPRPSPSPSPIATAPPSVTPFVCPETNGRVIESSFYSQIAGEDVRYRMYQPPCFYETLRRYPYVLLLHGTGYDDSMWVDLDAPVVLDAGIADGTLPPMVLIMPDGGYLSELNDQPDGTSYETVLLDELLPMLETDFCLWGSRSGRAIGGISRGGFWAFSIALRYPEMFSALGGHSPHFDPDNAAPEYNPLSLAARANLTTYPLRIYLDHAADDYVSTNVIELFDILRSRDISPDYLIDPVGNHDMDYWRAHVPAYLQFYGQNWPRDVLSLPSCLEPSPR